MWLNNAVHVGGVCGVVVCVWCGGMCSGCCGGSVVVCVVLYKRQRFVVYGGGGGSLSYDQNKKIGGICRYLLM